MSSTENSKYLPINLNIDNQNILIVGAGNIALRKIQILLQYNVNITIISPEISEDVKELVLQNTNISFINEPFNSNILEKTRFYLVFAATNNEKLNKDIAKQASKKGILSNIVTSSKDSHFIMPAIIKEGDFQIAISTSGCSPLLAKIVKEDLQKNFIPQISSYTKILKEIRNYMQTKHKDDFNLRQYIYNKVLCDPVLLKKLSSEELKLSETLNLLIEEQK